MTRASTEVADQAPRFVDDAWPLIVCVSPAQHSHRTVEQLAAGYERLFARGERYALISASPRVAATIGARERKAIADWASSPRVRTMSRELCVGSATIARDALSRGALTAILWLWKPSSPHHVTGSDDDAVDWCLGQLESARVPMPLGAREIRRRTIALLRSL